MTNILPWRHAGGIILRLTYGYQVQDGEDPFVNLIEKANNNFNAATVPGAFPVDFFPILKRLPEWLPGCGFLRTARLWAKDTAAMVNVPYDFTKQEMVYNEEFALFQSNTQLVTTRLLAMPFHPSYPPVSKMKVHSPMGISEIWSLLQALCMAVSCTAAIVGAWLTREKKNLFCF